MKSSVNSITDVKLIFWYHVVWVLSKQNEDVEIVRHEAPWHSIPLRDSDLFHYVNHQVDLLEAADIEVVQPPEFPHT